MGSVYRFVLGYLLVCLYYFIRQLAFCRFFVGYSFGTVKLSVIVTKNRKYIESNGDFRYCSVKSYFGDLGRASLPNELVNSHLDTAICLRWPQSMVFECGEVWNMKGCDHTTCQFCVRIVFERSDGSYVIKVCRLAHLGHVVNLSSISGHVEFEADLSIEEKSQLVTFGKFGYTNL